MSFASPQHCWQPTSSEARHLNAVVTASQMLSECMKHCFKEIIRPWILEAKQLELFSVAKGIVLGLLGSAIACLTIA